MQANAKFDVYQTSEGGRLRIERRTCTESENPSNGSWSYHLTDFLRLYAFGFDGFFVTGLISPQLPRRAEKYAFCSRFERFSSGMYFCFNLSTSYQTNVAYPRENVMLQICFHLYNQINLLWSSTKTSAKAKCRKQRPCLSFEAIGKGGLRKLKPAEQLGCAGLFYI